MGIAGVNAWYLFTLYRRYDLRFRTVRLRTGNNSVLTIVQSPVDSPNAKTVPKPELGETEVVESRRSKILAFAR
jgi:hypothetical protein